MNQDGLIAELEARERDLEIELKKVRAAKEELIGKGRSFPRQMTVREGLLKLLREQDGQFRRDLPGKLAGLGAPCTPNTLQITISRHKDLFRREGGRVWLR
jgi:hypothetical protein